MCTLTAMPLGSTVDVFTTDDPNITETAEQELQIYEKKDNVLHGHRKKRYFIQVSMVAEKEQIWLVIIGGLFGKN